jgi:hypothetical protein
MQFENTTRYSKQRTLPGPKWGMKIPNIADRSGRPPVSRSEVNFVCPSQHSRDVKDLVQTAAVLLPQVDRIRPFESCIMM